MTAVCESGAYGVNCGEDCNDGCDVDTCDVEDGDCDCMVWWTGTTVIPRLVSEASRRQLSRSETRNVL